MKKYHYIVFLLCILLSTSCVVDEQCRQNTQVQLEVGFYHVKKSITQDTITTSTLTIDTLTVKGLKFDSINSKYILADSILYNNSRLESSLLLPLHKFENVSKYQITFKTKIDTVKVVKIDTLTVLHQNTNDYLSLECGCIKIHSIDTVFTTNHFADSIRIVNHNVNNINAENIRIYK